MAARRFDGRVRKLGQRLAVYLARTGRSKEQIRSAVAHRFDYDLDRTVAAIRLAVSLGGDADTQTCIAARLPESSAEMIRGETERRGAGDAGGGVVSADPRDSSTG